MRVVTDGQYFTNILVSAKPPSFSAGLKCTCYAEESYLDTVAMSNQCAMQKSHMYSTTGMRMLKS